LSKIDEGESRIREKVQQLISCYEDLKKEKSSIEEIISRLEHELEEKNSLCAGLESKCIEQTKKLEELDKTLKGFKNLQEQNSILKENLGQISLEFQNTREELDNVRTQTKEQFEGTKQEVGYVKSRINDMILKIDNVLTENLYK